MGGVFLRRYAEAFVNVRAKASEVARKEGQEADQEMLLRELDERQRQALSLFKENKFVTTKDVVNGARLRPLFL